jgi:hypothetical protein
MTNVAEHRNFRASTDVSSFTDPCGTVFEFQLRSLLGQPEFVFG